MQLICIKFVPHLKVLEMVSFGSHTHITHLQLTACRISAGETTDTTTWMFPSQLSFNMFHNKKLHRSRSSKQECHNFQLIILSPKTLNKQCTEQMLAAAVALCFWQKKKVHGFSHNWTGAPKMESECNILVWIYGLLLHSKHTTPTLTSWMALFISKGLSAGQ